MIRFEGIPEMQQRMDAAVERMRENAKRVINSILIEFVNEAKSDSGGFVDRTGNLRNSIGYVPAFDGSAEDARELFSKMETGQRVDFQAPLGGGSGKITGIMYAGMEYAVYVEFMEGHYVIGGAWSHLVTKFEKLFTERMRRLS